MKHRGTNIPMVIMISGVESDKYWNIVVEQCGVKYVLMSYHYMKSKPKDFLKKRLEKHPDVKVFIDSGTFTFVQKMDEYKDKPDSFWEKYMTEYTEWVRYNKEHIFACADLDLDILVGTEKVDEWRKKYFEPLQKEGIEVCYIWHEERSMQGWEEMCRRYPYVGLSTENADFTLQKLMRMLNIAKKYNSRVHGMATTKTDLLVRVPFFSCDSTTWIVGQQYGELNWFDGRSMKRLSKQQWRRNYKTQLLKPPFNADWDLLINGMGGRGDTYELLRLNVLAFVIAEEHIRKRLGKKMYWLSGEVGTTVPVRDISEVMLPSKEWFNNGLQDDYINYLEELNLPTTIEKQEALDLLWEFYIHVNRDDEELERSEDEVLFNFCKIVLKEEVDDREEALDMIHQYYVDNATGNRTDVIESYEQEEVVENNRPKERKDYITESDFEVIDLSPNDMETLALPAPREDMPEVDEYDEILRQNDIVPVRDERGRFIKGQKKVRKPKSVYSDKYPKLACDTCYKSGDCPDYRPGYVCAFHKMFKRFDTRDLNDVVDAMQSMANSNLERMQRAMMFEIMDGGMVTPEVTGLIDQNMRLLSQMKELLTYAPKTVLQQKRIVREDGTEETITQMNVNPSQGGILSKIFGGNAPSKEEEAIDAEFTVEKE